MPHVVWRRIDDELRAWKADDRRNPLMLRGVRGCGKTYALTKFGEECYSNTVYVNMEREKAVQGIFEKDLDPERIVSRLSDVKDARIEEEDTLIVFDEIQACPDAITSLKYFCEDAPGYHVAAAGSLLGVPLDENASYPVGKVDVMTMRPMDLEEWLVSDGLGASVDSVRRNGPFDTPLAILDRLEESYRRYLFVGGMPEAVSAWMGSRDSKAVQKVQDGILSTYDSDFLKHVPDEEGPKVSRVWESVPEQLAAENGRFFYNHVKGGRRAADLEDAVQWLVKANLLLRVGSTDTPLVPLNASSDRGLFKLYMCDTGLLSCKVDAELPFFTLDSVKSTTSPIFRGVAAENYVLTQLVDQFGTSPRYWRNGKHEVDFLIQHHNRVIPIEVRSGERTRAESLGRYIDTYSPERSVVLSMAPPEDGDVIKLPLYLAWMLRDVLDRSLGEAGDS